MTHEELCRIFPVHSIVTASDEFPGVYRVNQPVSYDGYLHLVPHDDVAKQRIKLSLIISADQCAPVV